MAGSSSISPHPVLFPRTQATGSSGGHVRLDGRILAFDSDAARLFSRIAARRRLGKPISHPDAQIAAIGQLRNARRATGNAADFADCDIQVIDPWDASRGDR